MIDFAALVLGPAMAVFGEPVTIAPTKSQPGAPAYPARGVYALKPVEIPIEGSDLFQRSHQSEFGIRLAEFSAQPRQGDTLSLSQGAFEVFDVLLDGQGGATLVLRKVS